MATSVVKKSTQKRHNLAIAAYQTWLSENTDATEKEKIEQFDFLVDTAFLNEKLNGD